MIDKIGRVPRRPGVYLFKDEAGKILYIGKAKVLRNRVRSYFRESAQRTPKTISLLSKACEIEWIVTSSDVEALLTEANLIKQHAPRYNVNLKDDKSFPYIRITNSPFPQVLLTRKIVKDGSKYFGPYTDVKTLRKTLKVIHKVFPIRSCNYAINSETISQGRTSVCLDYHIKKCGGPCEGFVSEGEYNDMIRSVIRFLQGRTDDVIRFLRGEMDLASSETRYEEAALYRDQIRAIDSFARRQRTVSASFDDRDVIAIAVHNNDACAVVLRLRIGKVSGREKIYLTGVGDERMERTISDFIRQFYLETDFVPGEIIVPSLPEEREPLIEWLEVKRGKRVHLTVPRRGEKARLLQMALQNAHFLLEEYAQRKAARKELVPVAVQQLQSDLRLSVPPRRIEAFDISNIQGQEPVASMVCFVDGKPRKTEYRKFKIKTVRHIDDFAMMREVVFRRYARLRNENAAFPDLILIDGGKGQLGMAMSALQQLGLTYLPVVSLAKRLEEVFLPGFPEPQSIPKTSPGLTLLRRIRDEAHRFAITFHRQRRGKGTTESIFDRIKGVGPVTKNRIFSHFDSIQTIADSTVQEMCNSVKVPQKIAAQIISTAKAFTSVPPQVRDQ